MKKILKITFISITIILAIAFFSIGTWLLVSYLKFSSIPLNVEALTYPSMTIEVYDNQNRLIEEQNNVNLPYVQLEKLPNYTKDAFISIEDKEFYNHKGLNYKRILKAVYNNLRSMSLKEGASTISQQLIKNTHLSNEKTFERKLKEVALTKKLEASFSKDEILESYLNIIYFGNNCYGIESAANYYFNKPAKDLNLEESCTLAGMIKSPYKYSPISSPQNCQERRNIVLKEMENDGKINVNEYLSAIDKPITLTLNEENANKLNSYSQASIDEASKILNIPAKQLALGGYKIHTYQDPDSQMRLKESLTQTDMSGCDNAMIVIDNKKHGVKAFYGQSAFKILDTKRQVGSCIKPILVYGPALNENVITPETEILDEEICIGDWRPSNVNKTFQGYVSVTDAVKKSINIPAIKVLSYIGIETGKQYAEKMGLSFDEKDDSYVLALGGLTYGEDLLTLTNAYTTFANKGRFADAKFVSYITDSSNKLVYVNKPVENQVLREDSAYLMTKMLQESARSGTAKKLSGITNVDVASKTGTVGKNSGNTDAYNISYTPNETIGVWCGNLDNTTMKISGGNQPTEVARKYLSTSLESETFEIPSSVMEAKVDLLEKEKNHRLVLANPLTPERFVKTCLFSRFNLPEEISQNFTEKPSINADCKVSGNQILLNLNTQRHVVYEIYKDNILHQTISEKQEKLSLHLNFSEENCTIKIVAKYYNCDEKSLQNEQNFHLTKSEKVTKQKWYI